METFVRSTVPSRPVIINLPDITLAGIRGNVTVTPLLGLAELGGQAV